MSVWDSLTWRRTRLRHRLLRIGRPARAMAWTETTSRRSRRLCLPFSHGLEGSVVERMFGSHWARCTAGMQRLASTSGCSFKIRAVTSVSIFHFRTAGRIQLKESSNYPEWASSLPTVEQRLISIISRRLCRRPNRMRVLRFCFLELAVAVVAQRDIPICGSICICGRCRAMGISA